MLVSHAHSFRQQARLAVTLAWIAGYTNILTVLACGTVTSHVSGTTSTLGREIFSGTWGVAGYSAFLLTCFFIGAGISGFCTELGRRRGWESIFVLPMMIETLLLAVFAFFLQFAGPPTGPGTTLLFLMTGLASGAMGLQNATITQISRGQVRTTHVTGVLTDLGQEFVQFCWWLLDRRRKMVSAPASGSQTRIMDHPTGRRLLLLASIYGIFAIGAGLGTVVYMHSPRFAMYPPVAFLLWIIYQDVATPIAEIESQASGIELPPSLTVFRLRKDQDRVGRVHRIPNLLAWSDRLPPETRVAILDLVEMTEFNTNAFLELKILLERFAATHRVLILSGIGPSQIHQMAAGDALPIENLCPDLDLAIARGLNCLRQFS